MFEAFFYDRNYKSTQEKHIAFFLGGGEGVKKLIGLVSDK
jgi:hypothetical protein